MTRQRLARAVLIGLIGGGLFGVSAVFDGAGVARADDDAILPIIGDLGVAIPSQTLDPRDRDGISHHWPGTGNFCQNRFITCRVGGF
jgi:hypothetical protein